MSVRRHRKPRKGMRKKEGELIGNEITSISEGQR